MPANANLSNNPRARPLVMGYYPSYRAQLAPAEIRADRFTHVLYSFAQVNAGGELDAASCAGLAEFVQIARAQGVQTLIGLSGGSNGAPFAQMARDESKRARFVADIAQVMKQSGADGLALDWEQPTAQDIEINTRLVHELRAAIQAADGDATLTLVVNANAAESAGYDGPALRDAVDYLHIMSYDFHGPWNHAGHHANLFASEGDAEGFSFPKGLEYWRDVQGFPVGKILMGLAGYGRGFRAPAWESKPTEPSRYPEISYAALRGLIGHGWSRQWDAAAHAPWLLSDDKTERISYDDPQSVADKALWMKRNGLAGFFIWELTQEAVEGDNVLTAAALQAWVEAPTSPTA